MQVHIKIPLIIIFFSLISISNSFTQEITSSVISVENITSSEKGILKLGDYISVEIKNLSLLIKNAPSGDERIVLYMNNIPITGIHPETIDTVNDIAVFRLQRDSVSLKSWKIFYKYPRDFQKKVRISVGYYNYSIPSEAKNLTFIFVRKIPFYLSLIVIVVLVIILFILGKKSNIIRDQSTSTIKPFSLSRTQLAFWTVLIFFSFTFIWAVTGDLPGITGTTLTLLSISIVTTAGAKVIDTSQIEMIRHQDTGSKGFIIDMLSDEKGVNIHRFQLLVWTLLIGVFFVRYVIINLEMPQLDDNLLILMGISSGTYVGLKIPENSQKK